MSRTRFPPLGSWILATLALAVVAVIVLRLSGDVSTSLDPVRPAESKPISSTSTREFVSSEPPAGSQREHVAPSDDAAGGQRITVLDEDGRPILGAVAWTEDLERPHVSDSAGVVRFLSAQGEVTVIADGFLPARTSVSELPQELRLVRDPGLALTLRWEDGAPVVGAGVELAFERADAQELRAFPEIPVTDGTGRTIVPGYRSGKATADLWVRLPGAQRTLVLLPDDLDLAGPAMFEARVARDAASHSVRVVDAEGRPLAGRAVTYRWNADDTARTDEEGLAVFGNQEQHADRSTRSLGYGGSAGLDDDNPRETSYTVELEPGRSWWHEPELPAPAPGEQRTVRAAYRRVFGRVESPSPAAYVVASAATVELGNVRNAAVHPEGLLDLHWQPVRADGGFEIGDGWQGPESVVILHHRDGAFRLWLEPVPEGGGPVVLRAPAVCKVTVRAQVPAGVVGSVYLETQDLDQPPVGEVRTAAFGISFMEGGYGTAFPLENPPATIELPCARYEAKCFASENEWDCGVLDATGPTATLRIVAPELLLVRGRVSGSMRGALQGVAVRLRSESLRIPRSVETGADGWFAALMPAAGPIVVEQVPGSAFHTSGSWTFHSENSLRRLEPPLGVDRPVAEYVIEEGLLQIVERPPSPLLRTKGLALRSDRGARRALELDENGWAEFHVAPGTYELVRRLDAAHIQRIEVTVGVDERVQVVLDSSRVAMLVVVVEVSDPELRELRLRVRDAEGSIEALDSERRLKGPVHEFREVLEPGVYEVQVESKLRGASLEDPPIDVWRGEIDVQPGARQPLRVQLR
jgi:hypothetical protein